MPPFNEHIGPDAAVLMLGPETDQSRAFLEAVTAHELVLGKCEDVDAPVPLVVLITDAEPGEPPESLLSGRDILPVTFTDEFTGVLPELSHLAPSHQGIAVAAERLAKAISIGGTTLAGWERLASRSVAWERSSAASNLLSEPEQTEALALLASPPAHLVSAVEDRAKALVKASRAHSLKRRRRWQALFTVTIIVLASVIVVAGIQTQRATSAARESTAAANAADGRRLTVEAFEAQGRDPDVPLILASLADQLTDDPEVHNAVSGIVGDQIAHASIMLTSTPRQIVSSASGRYAYSSFDDMLVRVTNAEGSEIASFLYGSPDDEYEGAQIELSPHGDRVAVLTANTGPRVFEVDTGESFSVKADWNDESDALIGWWDDATLLVGSEVGVELLKVATGSRTTLIETPSDTSAVTRAAASPAGSTIAVTDGEQVQVWDLSTPRLLATAELDRVTALAVNDAGSVVFAARYPALTRIDFGEETTVTSDPLDRASVAVRAFAGDYFISSDRRGGLAVYHPELGVDAVARFRAHLDDNVRIAGDPSSTTVASVSIDKYLRIWDMSDLGLVGTHTIAGPVDNDLVAGVLDFGDVLDASFPKVTFRNQVRLVTDDVLAVALPARGAALVDSADVLQTHESAGLPAGGIAGRTFISQNAGYMVRMMYNDDNRRFSTELWRIADDGTHWGAEPIAVHDLSLPATLLGPGAVLIDVGENEQLVVGSNTELSVHTADGQLEHQPVRYLRPSSPIAVSADFGGRASSVTEDGMLYRVGMESMELGAPDQGDSRITAAEFEGDTLWFLTSTGAIAKMTQDGIQALVPPGQVAGVGSLRLSPDGAMLAHVGAAAVSIIDTFDGQVLGRQRSPMGIGVDDVCFTSDSSALHVVSTDGAVAKWNQEQMSPQPPVVAPRQLTPEESLAFDVPEGSNG